MGSEPEAGASPAAPAVGGSTAARSDEGTDPDDEARAAQLEREYVQTIEGSLYYDRLAAQHGAERLALARCLEEDLPGFASFVASAAAMGPETVDIARPDSS